MAASSATCGRCNSLLPAHLPRSGPGFVGLGRQDGREQPRDAIGRNAQPNDAEELDRRRRFRRAINAGINIVRINTELRVAWRRGLEGSLAKKPDEVVPYKILPSVIESVKEVAGSRLRLFNGNGLIAQAV
jgi:hypothetical protein